MTQNKPIPITKRTWFPPALAVVVAVPLVVFTDLFDEGIEALIRFLQALL